MNFQERLKRTQGRWEQLPAEEKASATRLVEQNRKMLAKCVARIEAQESELTSGSTDLYAVVLEVCEATNSDMFELLEMDCREFDRLVSAILRKRKNGPHQQPPARKIIKRSDLARRTSQQTVGRRIEDGTLPAPHLPPGKKKGAFWYEDELAGIDLDAL